MTATPHIDRIDDDAPSPAAEPPHELREALGKGLHQCVGRLGVGLLTRKLAPLLHEYERSGLPAPAAKDGEG